MNQKVFFIINGLSLKQIKHFLGKPESYNIIQMEVQSRLNFFIEQTNIVPNINLDLQKIIQL